MNRTTFITALLATFAVDGSAQQILAAGQPAQLDIRAAGERSIRVTLKPLTYARDFPFSPAVVERNYAVPAISVRTLGASPVRKRIGALNVDVRAEPLSVVVTNTKGEPVQTLTFENDGRLTFLLGDQPVLGMGEGGPKPEPGKPWREQPIQFDRRGRMDTMEPRWQSDAYGSRNPVATLMSPGGWGLFVATPWVQVDLTQANRGAFVPWKPTGKESVPQNEKNQQLAQGKGLPPIDAIVPGLYDVFVFDAHEPASAMNVDHDAPEKRWWGLTRRCCSR